MDLFKFYDKYGKEIMRRILRVYTRALEILKSESVQPMTMTSSMSPFPKKKNMYISPVTKTNDNWQSYNSFSIIHLNSVI